MPHDLCCRSPFHIAHTSRPLSPDEPPRPLLTNLDSVFALAALPPDHPNAFRHLDARAPDLPQKGLLRSPSFVWKATGRLRRRRTCRDLRFGAAWDGDARRVCTGEVEEVAGRVMGDGNGVVEEEEVEQGGGCGDAAPRLCLRDMSPLNGSPEFMRFRPCSPGPVAVARRCRSSIDLGVGRGQRPLPEFGDVEFEGEDKAPPTTDLHDHQLDGAIAARSMDDGDDIEVTGLDPNVALEPTSQVSEPVMATDDNNGRRPASSTSVHLGKLHIGQQLRSMSQLSDLTHRDERLTPETWTFHRRERSKAGLTLSSVDTGRGEDARKTSQSGVDSAHIPASWGKVRRERDNSSSIYSRPTSPEEQGGGESNAEIATWPLAEVFAPPPITVDEKTQCSPQALTVGTPTRLAAPHTPQTLASAKTLSTVGSKRAESIAPAARTSSAKSGSSNLTKRSKFLERFTPPKRLVKKNRSFFRFLRAGNSRRQQQPRSMSSPVLRSTPRRTSGRFDGPADEGEVLNVQYELAAPEEANAVRSASLSNLPSFELTQESLDVPGEIERKPSLADYERNLSLMGDDRRRPSAANLRRLSEIREDDRRASLQVRRSFSHKSGPRENTLMEAALERQLAEKELFRAPSKRSIPSSPQVSPPAFGTTTWTERGLLQTPNSEQDPLDAVASGALSARRPSEARLSPPRTPLCGPSGSLSVPDAQSGSKKPVVLETPSSASQLSAVSRRATPLSSWSRYPSHTRDERCASAGLADRVNTHDFAVRDINPADIRTTDETDAFDPSKPAIDKRSSKHSRASRLPRSRSATFGAIVRYYSNVFSNAEFHVKGRRSSVAAGGRLKDPELEILPPIMPVPVGTQAPVCDEHGITGRLAHVNEGTGNGERPDCGSPTPVDYSPFRESSFGTAEHERTRQISTVEPLADSNESGTLHRGAQATLPLLGQHQMSSPQERRHLHLDGTSDQPSILPSSPSKAEVFSSLYQTCLSRPLSPPVRSSFDSASMPPPALRPTKARSPRSKSLDPLDPASRIRRFPSVTVVDDRKGHWRSVSFISVKTDTSNQSFLRESSNDLLKLMEEREREEREKLMRGV